MSELNVITKTQYCSCLLQNFEWTVYATLCIVAYSPIRTYRFFKNNTTYAYSSMVVHLYCHRFLKSFGTTLLVPCQDIFLFNPRNRLVCNATLKFHYILSSKFSVYQLAFQIWGKKEVRSM
jgi:hypothetical protein